MSSNPIQTIFSGDKTTIENTSTSAVALQLVSANGYQVDIELQPGQIIGFSAGPENADVIITEGDPEKVLIIKPETAS